MGIPSITSNLSGFGCFMQEHVSDPQSYGIYILDRKFISVEESVRKLAQLMFDFSQLTRKQRILQRNRTERLSDLLDWRKLHKYYTQSRVRALQVQNPDFDPPCKTESIGSIPFRFPRPASSYAPSSVGKVGAANNSADDLDAESEEEDLDLEIKDLGIL